MPDRFDTTRWSLILDAGGEGDDARDALETLCRTYRPPVLAYVRARPGLRDAAEDLTQAFFAHLLEQRLASRADRERGRFRAFLLTSLKYFLSNEHDRATAQRRGGGQTSVVLEDFEPPGDDDPEQAFEREWAQTILRQARARLQQEARHAGRTELFVRLQPFLLEPPRDSDYESVASALGLRRNTVAVAVHRLRARLQALVREMVADSAGDAAAAEVELRRLRGCLEAGGTRPATHPEPGPAP